jgi:hypothetical protein
MKQLELMVIEKITGLDKGKIGRIYNKEKIEEYDFDIVLILAIISFVIQVAPIIIEWWKKRKLLAKINIFFIISKQIRKSGDKNISAIKLTDAFYDIITNNPKLVEEYNA